VEKWGAANAPSYTLLFRNTGILSTGLAIANVAPHATSVSAIALAYRSADSAATAEV
jgi:hypothetical protein